MMPCFVPCFLMPRALVRSTAARRRLAWALLSTTFGGIPLTSASARLQAARLVPRTTPDLRPRSRRSHRHSTPSRRQALMLEERTARERARVPRGRHRVRRSRRTTTASQRRTRMQCRVHRRTHRSPRSARGCEHATLRTVPLGDRGVRGICMNIGRGSLAPECGLPWCTSHPLSLYPLFPKAVVRCTATGTTT